MKDRHRRIQEAGRVLHRLLCQRSREVRMYALGQAMAETVPSKRQVEIMAGTSLEKRRPMSTTFDELAAAYLRYARDNKQSWDRDATSIRKLGGVCGAKRVTESSTSAVKRHKAWRMATKTIHGRCPRPATGSPELACLKDMWNVVRKGLIDLKGGVPAENPMSIIKFFDEQTLRNRVLTPEEFERMVELSSDSVKPILRCALHAGMRKAAMWNLLQDRVALKAGLIRWKANEAKTKEARRIPIGRELRDMSHSLPTALVALESLGARVPSVFTR